MSAYKFKTALPNYHQLHAGVPAIVLGLGSTGRAWRELTPRQRGDVFVYTVNDGAGVYGADYCVCIDDPGAFTAERISRMQQTDCDFLTDRPDLWEPLVRGVFWTPGRVWRHDQKLEWFGTERVDDRMAVSLGSPISAAWLAGYMGCSIIGVLGVDLMPGSVHEPWSSLFHPLYHKREEVNTYWRRFAEEAKRVLDVEVVTLAEDGHLTSLRPVKLKEFLGV